MADDENFDTDSNSNRLLDICSILPPYCVRIFAILAFFGIIVLIFCLIMLAGFSTVSIYDASHTPIEIPHGSESSSFENQTTF